MLKWMFSGAALLVVGAIKFALYLGRTPTLEDYLAFRCGASTNAASGALHVDGLLPFAHCWGCYAMAAGAAILLVGAVQAIRQAATGERLGAGLQG